LLVLPLLLIYYVAGGLCPTVVFKKNARVVALTIVLKKCKSCCVELNNCYFVPSLSRNILSPSCLMKDGYSFASASIVNGLFVLNLDDSPIYNISAKRSRPNDLSPTYI
jgi:hypothetical protein